MLTLCVVCGSLHTLVETVWYDATITSTCILNLLIMPYGLYMETVQKSDTLTPEVVRAEIGFNFYMMANMLV